jgi:hypothetical protein
MENILKTIDAEYLLSIDEFKGMDLGSLITPDIILIAKKDVDDNFTEYLKSHELENKIKQAGLHYFITIYLLMIQVETNKIPASAGMKEKFKELVSENNGIQDLRKTLPNFDFYLGACGIEAQNLATKLVKEGKMSLF